MSEWEAVQLGDICSLRGGAAFPQKEQGNSMGEVPFIKVSDLGRAENTRTIEVAGNWLLQEQIDRMRPVKVPMGSVVFAKIGEGLRSERVRRVKKETAIDNNLMAAIPAPDRIDSEFFYYLMRTIRLSSLAVGSALPYLKQSDLALVPCKVPARESQRQIGAVLGSLDEKIEANRKLAATADDLAVSLLSPFDSSVPLRQVAEQSKVSLNPQSLNDQVVAHYSLPAFDEGAGPQVVAAADIKSNKYCLQNPAVLVSKLNPRFPRVWNVADIGKSLALASTEFVVLEPTNCSTHVLWAMTRHIRFARSLQSLVAGTSGSHQRVGPVEILETLVPDPREVPIEVQSFVDATVRRSLAATKENHSLAVLRDTLLPKLMSGQLRVEEAAELVRQ